MLVIIETYTSGEYFLLKEGLDEWKISYTLVVDSGGEKAFFNIRINKSDIGSFREKINKINLNFTHIGKE